MINTRLVFCEGAILQREECKSGVNGNAFINKGALKGEYNRNIEIIGLHLECNGVESSDFGVNSRIAGLRAQVAMIYVENLKIDKFECHGLLEKDYANQVCAFKDIILNDIYVTGNKDGIHLGWGDGFLSATANSVHLMTLLHLMPLIMLPRIQMSAGLKT